MNEPRAVLDTGIVEFTVDVSGRRVKARITRQALEDHFHASEDPATWVRACIANAGRIDRAVERLVQAGVVQPVIVRTSHF